MYEARQNKEKVSRRIGNKKNIIQKVTWEDDSEKPGEKVCEDYMPNGFIWHYIKANRKMYYTTTYALVHSIKDKAHRQKIEQFANRPLSYEDWKAAGWVYPDTVRDNSFRVIKHDDIKDYIGQTSGVEIENPTQHIICLKNEKDRGIIARISVDGIVMAEITTDMMLGKEEIAKAEITSNVNDEKYYTIELRTTPVANADEIGLKCRKNAIRAAIKAITNANFTNGRTIKNENIKIEDNKEFTVEVLIKNHTIMEAKNRRKCIQITKGISLTDMINEASKPDGFFKEAQYRWMAYYSTYLNQYPNEGKEIYAMLASLIHFYLKKIDDFVICKNIQSGKSEDQSNMNNGIGGKGVKNAVLETRPDLTNPARKNDWKLLPKTAPQKWLDGLASDVALNIKKALNTVPKELNEIAWNTIKNEILSGSEIAGHPVPDFTINNEKAFAFEMRTPPIDEVKKYIDT